MLDFFYCRIYADAIYHDVLRNRDNRKTVTLQTLSDVSLEEARAVLKQWRDANPDLNINAQITRFL